MRSTHVLLLTIKKVMSMLMYGLNIQSSADKLQQVNVSDIFRIVTKPDNAMLSKIKQLRMVKQLDCKLYSSMKRTLPYFVCGSYNLPFRRTENFAFTDHFVIDIDHILDKGMDICSLRHRIQNDERVELCYVSPGEDGLKVLFRLSEKCYDAGMYSLFYKTFVKKFSVEYDLQQVVDSRTSDVTRACFISYDKDAYYNDKPVPVDMNTYLDCNNVQTLFDIKKEFKKIEQDKTDADIIISKNPDPDAITLDYIKQTLSEKTSAIKKEVFPVFVPQVLIEAMTEIKQCIEETGIIVDEIIDIQYGKKVRVKLGLRLGEINIFYGKRGFSVVQSPRRGTSGDLNQVTADIVNAYFAL